MRSLRRPLLGGLALRGSRQMAQASLVAGDNPWVVWGALAACAAAGHRMQRTRVGAALSGPVFTMALASALGALGVLPAPTAEFRLVQAAIVRLSTPLLLLVADLRVIAADTGSLLTAFVCGMVGTTIGACLGLLLLGEQLAVVDGGVACCCALAAKNVGSGLNFMAVAQSLDVPSATVAAALAVDNVGALTFFPLLSVLGGTRRGQPKTPADGPAAEAMPVQSPGGPSEPEMAVGSMLAAGAAAMLLAGSSPSLAVVTLRTVCLATLARRWVRPFAAAGQALGAVLLYIFFATAGLCGVAGFRGATCWPLVSFTAVLYAVHLAVVLALGAIMRQPLRLSLVASSANIGGPATASSLAVSRGWLDLATPAVLVGTLGNCVATFLALGLHRVASVVLH